MKSLVSLFLAISTIPIYVFAEKSPTITKSSTQASIELAKDWRTDKYLRNLEAMLIVSDGSTLLILTGSGDVLEPENNIAAVGSGGNYALAAARGLYDTAEDTEVIASKALKIASEICVYTNGNLISETLKSK